jgi:hypothetical protein
MVSQSADSPVSVRPDLVPATTVTTFLPPQDREIGIHAHSVLDDNPNPSATTHT